MNAPQAESKYGSMVPAHVFEFLEANFVIPADKDARDELRRKLEEYSHYGVMHLPENKKVRTILQARIMAIEAYDVEVLKVKKENKKDKIESRREKIAALATELSQSWEKLPFPVIDPEAYLKLKADIKTDEEASGYTTIMFDDLVERFKTQGMKVVLGKYPGSGNVYIVPSESNDIENDSISPRHLQVSGITNENLRELISIQEKMRSFTHL